MEDYEPLFTFVTCIILIYFSMKKLRYLTIWAILFHALPMANINAKNSSLVVYFSHSGHTRSVAIEIKNNTGATIFEIIPEKNYSSNYQALLDQAKAEINAGAHPAIKPIDSGIELYDTIYVGSPCWWGTIAPPVATFLSSYDFSGKVIVPFMTHEGSGMGHSEKDIRALCPKAVLLKGLPVRGSLSDQAAPQIKEWLQKSIYRQN